MATHEAIKQAKIDQANKDMAMKLKDYHNELLAAGFDKEDAISLTIAFQGEACQYAFRTKKEEEEEKDEQ